MNVHARRTQPCAERAGPTQDTRGAHAGHALCVRRLRIGHEPHNIRVSSGWANDCYYLFNPTYVHIIYWYYNHCRRVA